MKGEGWAVVGAGLAANLLLFLPAPLWLQTLAVLLLTALLPGALLVEWLIGRDKTPPSPGERLLLSIGAGYSSMVLITMLLSYLPGGLNAGQTLTVYDLVVLALLMVTRLRPPRRPGSNNMFAFVAPHNRWVWLALLSLLLVGGFFRFANLGYAEFQGDEARLALRAGEVIQGYENALFVHKKGPVEILLPTILFVLTDRLSEATARLPFALANLSGLFVIFVLGWRLFSPVAGWMAAMLLAVDGYILGFGRVVQYQSIVFLMDGLVVLLFLRLVRQPQSGRGYWLLAALFWATGLLAHYEAALVLFPGLFLLWHIWRQGQGVRWFASSVWPALLLGGLVLATFYAPFVRNPSFYDTYYYLTDYRMGGGKATFNHLAEFFARTTVYSSTYYLLTLIGLTWVGLVFLARQIKPGWLAWLLAGVATLGILLSFANPTWLILGDADYTWLFFLALLLFTWLLPGVDEQERLVWLWFGGPFLLALFFTAAPNTHVYSFFIPWALLAGMVVDRGWQMLVQWMQPRPAQWLALPVAVSFLLLFGLYEYWLFVYNRVEVLRTWPENRPRGYWVAYDMPVEVAIFGFPLNNGWKVVGQLYADGILQGNYDTNVRDVVAEWYTRGAYYCETDEPRYFMLSNPVEPTLADETAAIREALASDHRIFASIYVQGRPALTIYERTPTELQPLRFDLEEYATRFDRELATPRFERMGPVGNPTIQMPTAYRFGHVIQLRGYGVDRHTIRRGERVEVTLYWQVTQPIEQRYNLFVQVIDLADLTKAGQRDGQPGCNRHPTSFWLPGSLIVDRNSILIEPTARPGRYTVLIGLYEGDQRLEITGVDGKHFGPQLALTEIEIAP
jgi:4-amino-4-deoxy-L-arabinose transferase-like glycosyltransferase